LDACCCNLETEQTQKGKGAVYLNGRVLTCCLAVDCRKESEIILSYKMVRSEGSTREFATKITHICHDEFCEEHAYEFGMYFSNYLGLKVRTKRINRPVKVQFT